MVILYLTVAKLDTNPCFIMKLTNIECFLQISRSRRIQAVKRFPLKMYNTALSINSLPLIISHKHVFEVSSRVYLPTQKSCVCVCEFHNKGNVSHCQRPRKTLNWLVQGIIVYGVGIIPIIPIIGIIIG